MITSQSHYDEFIWSCVSGPLANVSPIFHLFFWFGLLQCLREISDSLAAKCPTVLSDLHLGGQEGNMLFPPFSPDQNQNPGLWLQWNNFLQQKGEIVWQCNTGWTKARITKKRTFLLKKCRLTLVKQTDNKTFTKPCSPGYSKNRRK